MSIHVVDLYVFDILVVLVDLYVFDILVVLVDLYSVYIYNL